MSLSICSGLKRWRTQVLLAVACLVLAVMPAWAQNAINILEAGSTVSGVLGPASTATTYVFDAGANSSATISLENVTGGTLALLISDINGNTIAQAEDRANAGAFTASDVLLRNGGRYNVFVYFAAGGGAPDTTFDIRLDLAVGDDTEGAEQAAPAAAAEPQLILLGAGIEARLNWNGAADLNLEVRDPTGAALHWNSRTTTNGGVFGFDANGLCQVISDSPEESAIWQPGFLSTGSYEVIVYYEQACDALTGTVPFQLEVFVDGASAGSLDALLAPAGAAGKNVYVTRFEIMADGGAALSTGGPNPDSSLTLLPAGFDFANVAATPLARDVPVLGRISNVEPFLVYSFAGAADELITLNMQAVGANLDTLLQIVDPAGKVVNVNDDAFSGTTDSAIVNARLLSTGRYTVIATRYAKEIGGTVGQFQVTLSGPTSDVADQATSLDLPQGDIEVSLYWSTSADLQLLVRDPAGQSVFDDSPLVASGGILQEAGNVNCVPAATGTPISYIYWPLGAMRPGAYEVEVWYQNACSDLPPPVDFTLLIEVLGNLAADAREFPQIGQRYVTNFTVTPAGEVIVGEAGYIDGGSATLAYQAEAFDAPQIESGQRVTGVISAENTFDVYQFDGVAGESVTISMSATTQTLDTNLYLISPGDLQIAANDDADPGLLGTAGQKTDSLISGYVLRENGPYTIIATRFANQYGGTLGVYSLTLRKN
ncbi:MAG: hypothetical protein OXG68_15490 [Chloroflexi bacterium]|nr:hypothetical protein [Chloroflexota bacterium]